MIYREPAEEDPAPPVNRMWPMRLILVAVIVQGLSGIAHIIALAVEQRWWARFWAWVEPYDPLSPWLIGGGTLVAAIFAFMVVMLPVRLKGFWPFT